MAHGAFGTVREISARNAEDRSPEVRTAHRIAEGLPRERNELQPILAGACEFIRKAPGIAT